MSDPKRYRVVWYEDDDRCVIDHDLRTVIMNHIAMLNSRLMCGDKLYIAYDESTTH